MPSNDLFSLFHCESTPYCEVYLQTMKQHEPPTLFYCYAHEDEALRNQLEKHLSLLRQQRLISSWHDREIIPGAEWTKEANAHLEAASIILLLVSSDFLASDYRYSVEMQRALERQKKREVYVIPVLLRPVDSQDAPFAHLQSLPRDNTPVTSWPDQDEAFCDIAKGIRMVVEHLRKVERMPPLPPLPSWSANKRVSSKNYTSRDRMLNLVRTFWIDGLLTQSLHHAARIELCLQGRPNVLDNPWRLQVQELDRSSQGLSEDTSIVEMYDRAQGELLILGEPGAGKTTLLLELTCTLLERAENNERLPMPIVFTLSSWAEKRQALDAWLVEELSTKYQVPRKIGQRWVDTGQVLPLLDGLDEVVEDARSACVKRINDYHQLRLEHGSSIVVCCRSEEYRTLSTRVMLQQAVSIQPLTKRQINTYLDQVGEPVKGLMRQALKKDIKLRELARQPLMLNIFTLAYQDATSAKLPMGKNREEMLSTLFARYVERMLYRRGQSKRWKPEQMIHYLTFLAKQMQQSHQSDFSVENLQPTWLSKKGKMFYQLCVELLWVHCGGLFIGFIGWSLGGWHLGFYEWFYFGPLLAVLSSVQILPDIHLKEMLVFSWKKVGYALAYSIMASMLFGLSGITVGWLVGWLVGWRVEKQHMREIHPTETFAWSWKKAGYMFLFCLITGPGFWLVGRMLSGLFTNIVFELSVGLVYGVVTGIFSSLSVGLSGRQLPKHLFPNDGMWRSGRSGLLFGVVAGMVGGLLSGPFGVRSQSRLQSC